MQITAWHSHLVDLAWLDSSCLSEGFANFGPVDWRLGRLGRLLLPRLRCWRLRPLFVLIAFFRFGVARGQDKEQ